MEGNGETEVEVYQCIGKQTKKKHFRGKSETELAHVQSFIDFIKKIKKKKLHRSISVHWKTKKKKTFRGNNETEVAHVQSFTDFNQKKKKSFTEGSEKTSLFLSCQTEVYP